MTISRTGSLAGTGRVARLADAISQAHPPLPLEKQEQWPQILPLVAPLDYHLRVLGAGVFIVLSRDGGGVPGVSAFSLGHAHAM